MISNRGSTTIFIFKINSRKPIFLKRGFLFAGWLKIAKNKEHVCLLNPFPEKRPDEAHDKLSLLLLQPVKAMFIDRSSVVLSKNCVVVCILYYIFLKLVLLFSQNVSFECLHSLYSLRLSAGIHSFPVHHTLFHV